MRIELTVQRDCETAGLPTDAEFQAWVDIALTDRAQPASLGLRIVDEAESGALNQRYRQRAGPTNVLSFAADVPEPMARELLAAGVAMPLGDLVLCAPVIRREAEAQGKGEQAHWAHLTVHGVLHLLGFDHQSQAEAAQMESRETELLARLGIADPYAPR